MHTTYSIMAKKDGNLIDSGEFKLEHGGFDITDEHPVYYKSSESNDRDFFILHAYTPEHFTLLTYIEVAGIVTTHFSTMTNKHELYDIIMKGMYNHKKLRLISREEYAKFKNIYDTYIKSTH